MNETESFDNGYRVGQWVTHLLFTPGFWIVLAVIVAILVIRVRLVKGNG